jgi:polyisoprenoid-binding protein YceI
MKLTSKIASLINLSLVLSFLFILAVALSPIAASAQSTWQIDQEHSIARLALGAGAQALEVGIAHVEGIAVFNPANPSGARFDLAIQPDHVQAPQYSKITFRSQRSWVDRDGNLVVAGDLTVTRLVRPVQVDANEGYHGAEYGEPVAYVNTKEAKLVFPQAKLGHKDDRAIRLSASTVVYGEDFPLLPAALQSGDWPNSLVEDRQTGQLSTIGEDYAGFSESGTQVVTATNSVPVGSGEGYFGFEPATQPDASKATISLDLKLNRTIAAGPDVTPSSGN